MLLLKLIAVTARSLYFHRSRVTGAEMRLLEGQKSLSRSFAHDRLGGKRTAMVGAVAFTLTKLVLNELVVAHAELSVDA